MKKLHEENIKNFKKRKEIDKIYEDVSNYYLKRLEKGTLDFSKERLLLESERTYYDSPAVNNLVTIFITMMVTPFTPEIIELFKNIFKNGVNLGAIIVAIIITGVFTILIIPGIINIIKSFANIHKSYKDRSLYYSICLDVLEKLEN
ncbi:hypothetical protein G6Z20_04680 [Clostridium perfringens]|uniref:hypothetical protein n=1 Tax=Clostridium perfringens TaxID=1502 RepID=UPI0013E28C89|nr:hypothetical protein [Clostridium perfringens]NGT05432.1 hypothetical protein [Clostridium perfringens]WFE16391.1 hypothetical protein P7C83_07535 [Clostridium perfringens]